MKQTAVQQWKDTETALRVARSGVLLTGPPSTGKSWAAKTLGLNFNGHRRPVYVVQCTDETPGVVAVGYERIVGGNMVFTPGPMPRAWGYDEDACLTGKPNGCVGRLVIEEIDKAGGDLLQSFLAAGDDPRIAQMLISTGIILNPQAGYQVVATSNEPHDCLPAALRSRFSIVINITEPNPKAIADLDTDLHKAAKASCVDPNEAKRIDIRKWRAFQELREDVDETFAARVVFAERADEILSDLKLARS